jgi:hypothetical protein
MTWPAKPVGFVLTAIEERDMSEELFIDHNTSIEEDEEQQEKHEWQPLDMSIFHKENLAHYLIYQAM